MSPQLFSPAVPLPYDIGRVLIQLRAAKWGLPNGERRMTTEQIKIAAAFIAGIAMLAILVSIAIWIWRRIRSPTSPDPDQIARISERVTYSAGGFFAMFLLVLSNAAAVYMWLTDMNILPERVFALLWIGSNMLWGIGIIVGRRRTYVVYKMPSPTE